MTKQERAKLCKSVFDNLQKGGYIKGSGKQKRIMSSDHSPLFTVNGDIFNLLEINQLIRKDGLIYRWSRNKFPDNFLFEKR